MKQEIVKGFETLVVVSVLLLAAGGSAQAQSILYVDASAAGASTGTSWTDAFTDLQSALSSAVAGDEIWVAAGMYSPSVPSGDPAATFQLQNDVAIYGGFAGFETMRSQRNPEANETILGNGVHIVTGSNTNATAILDGFTITGGVAGDDAIGGVGGAGAGMLIINGSPTIVACKIIGNTARLGSGVMIVDGSPTFTDCDISGNLSARSGEGSAIYDLVSTGAPSQHLTVTGCTFQSNTAYQGHFATGNGGAIYTSPGVGLTVTGCTFQSNFTFHNGTYGNATTGGAISHHGEVALISDSLFLGNYSSLGAGLYSTVDVTVINCVFIGNRAVLVGCGGPECGGAPDVFSGHGGGLYIAWPATASLIGCTLTGNWAAKTAAGAVMNGTVQNCILWGNVTYPVCCGENPLPLVKAQTDGGAGIFHSDVEGLLQTIPGEDPPNPADFPGSIDTDPLFMIDPAVSSLGQLTVLGELRLRPGSPCIDAGDNGAVPSGITTDLMGNPRKMDDPITTDTGQGVSPVVDMGAYEFATAAARSDLDNDGDVDANDFLTFSNCFNGAINPSLPGCANPDADCDADGDVDQSDFLTFSNCFNGALNPPTCL